jgi:hypothetical protein
LDVHEYLIKRNQVPVDSQQLIFVPENCVMLHRSCHENSRGIDLDCLKYVMNFTRPRRIVGWYTKTRERFPSLPSGNLKLLDGWEWEKYLVSLV